jgi:TfoX/Sxy family transcriptional regulator of competence genes
LSKGTIEAAYPPSDSERARDDMIRRLKRFGPLSWTPMFRGFGIYSGKELFCLVDNQGEAALRVSGATAQEFAQEGSSQVGRLGFWTIPSAVEDDQDRLEAWVNKTLEAVRQPKPRPSKG